MRRKQKIVDAATLIDTPSLLTRDQGSAFRKKVLELMHDQLVIQLTFNNVEVLSPSFADEAIAKLVAEMGVNQFRENITLVAQRESWKVLMNKVINRRMQQCRTE